MSSDLEFVQSFSKLLALLGIGKRPIKRTLGNAKGLGRHLYPDFLE
jgi:hypothetical protein